MKDAIRAGRDRTMTRRDFAKGGAAILGGAVVPRSVLGGSGHAPPSDRLNIGIIGVGGQGTELAQALSTEHIAAICDVDMGVVHRRVAERLKDSDGNPREAGERWREQFLRARPYADFRELLSREDDLDAVVIATPDHLHALIAKAAMEAGKHVYVEKPLAFTVRENRVLAELAESTGVTTQMGNQGHATVQAGLVNEWVRSGVIGPVREVNVWTNRPIWPQGALHPRRWEDGLNPGWYQQWDQGAIHALAADVMDASYPLPKGMDWDLFLGPTTRDLPYHPVYHPFNWRGWVDFGVSALGDMGAHLIDHPYQALSLTQPDRIESTSTPWGGPSEDPHSYPLSMRTHFHFPRRGEMPPVDLHWYDGGLMPPRPEGFPDDVPLNQTGGVIFVGDDGFLMHETYGGNPRLFPESLMGDVGEPPREGWEEAMGSHVMNWVDACKGLDSARCPFSYAARLTETMLLGIVALRVGQGETIRYDAERMMIASHPESNHLLTREYREGWEV